jgi:hypothetical protein
VGNVLVKVAGFGGWSVEYRRPDESLARFVSRSPLQAEAMLAEVPWLVAEGGVTRPAAYKARAELLRQAVSWYPEFPRSVLRLLVRVVPNQG